MYKWMYTDGISHEFHKNGKTYQNTDSMSLLEMKQLFMWLLHKYRENYWKVDFQIDILEEAC